MTRSTITRNVLLLSLVSLFADVASEMLYPVVPGYLRSIGFNVALIGVLEGTAELVAGVSKSLFGVWSDRIGRRAWFVRGGYLLGALSKPLMAVFTHPLWVFGVRTMDRVGKGMRTASRDALLSLETTPETKARVFGFHRAMDTVGAVVGPILALLLVHTYAMDLRTLFYLALIPGLCSVAITFLVRDKPRVANDTTSTVAPPAMSVSRSAVRYWSLSPPQFRAALRPILLFALFNSSDMFLLLYVTEKHGGTANALFVYILYNTSLALSAFPIGWLSDRTSVRPVLAAGIFLVGCVYGLLPCATSFAVVSAAFIVYGMGVAAFDSTSKAWVSAVVPEQQIGSAMGFLAGSQSIALLVASTVTGLIWSTDPGTAFSITGGMALLSALWILVRWPSLNP
jgi:MFS family permease